MVPSDMVTGENAICPTTRPSTTATSDSVSARDTQCLNDELLRVAAYLQGFERRGGHAGYGADVGGRLVSDCDRRIHGVSVLLLVNV
jgi:hypothetical protein